MDVDANPKLPLGNNRTETQLKKFIDGEINIEQLTHVIEEDTTDVTVDSGPEEEETSEPEEEASSEGEAPERKRKIRKRGRRSKLNKFAQGLMGSR